MNSILVYFLIQILILQIDIYIYIYHIFLKLIMLSNFLLFVTIYIISTRNIFLLYFIFNYNIISLYSFFILFLGTKADLWSTVSPKMAQRVFSGMLNESLSIIVTRFIYVILKKVI